LVGSFQLYYTRPSGLAPFPAAGAAQRPQFHHAAEQRATDPEGPTGVEMTHGRKFSIAARSESFRKAEGQQPPLEELVDESLNIEKDAQLFHRVIAPSREFTMDRP
jgi:hypothetical protein